jgi:hypothetical protein
MTEYNVQIKKARKGAWPIKWHVEIDVGKPFEVDIEKALAQPYRNVLFDGTMTMWGAKRKIAKAIKQDKKPKIQYNYKLVG